MKWKGRQLTFCTHLEEVMKYRTPGLSFKRKPKQVNTVSLTSTTTELQAIYAMMYMPPEVSKQIQHLPPKVHA